MDSQFGLKQENDEQLSEASPRGHHHLLFMEVEAVYPFVRGVENLQCDLTNIARPSGLLTWSQRAFSESNMANFLLILENKLYPDAGERG